MEEKIQNVLETVEKMDEPEVAAEVVTEAAVEAVEMATEEKGKKGRKVDPQLAKLKQDVKDAMVFAKRMLAEAKKALADYQRDRSEVSAAKKKAKGTSTVKRAFSQEEKDKIVTMTAEKKSMKVMASELGLKYQSFRNLCKKEGVEIPLTGRGRRPEKVMRKMRVAPRKKSMKRAPRKAKS